MMKPHQQWIVAVAVLALVAGVAGSFAEETPADAGEKVGFPGIYVRVAETEDGFVTMGFRTANESVGQDWMLLEVGITLPKGTPDHTLKRTDIALVVPGPKVVQLATQKEFGEAGHLVALNERANIARDSVNYFPPDATRACALSYFWTPGASGPRVARDQTDLSYNRACLGRVFFKIPGGIQYGTYNLDVKVANSTVRVPFKIMTKEDVKKLEKQLKEMKKK
jgi:hypothetical protein